MPLQVGLNRSKISTFDNFLNRGERYLLYLRVLFDSENIGERIKLFGGEFCRKIEKI